MAIAPSKPQEITGFERVIVSGKTNPKPSPVIPVDISDYWGYPSFSLATREPQEIVQPTPIVIDLTTPKPIVHNKGVPSVQAAKDYALAKLGATQYACIDQIFIHESHWNPLDLNKSSGAYGIPQALPGSKMAVIADDWRTNPITQVRWGIRYVNGRYGSACQAWSFWKINRWY